MATVVLVLLSGGLMGCDTVEPTAPPRLVVECFVQEGMPFPAVTLRKSRAVRRPYPVDDSATAALGGQITLELNDRTVPYEPVPGEPGRYAPPAGQQQTVPPRASFGLEVQWRDQTAQASGRVPPSITLDSVRISVPEEPVEGVLIDSLRLDTVNTDARPGYVYPVEVQVWWESAAETDSVLWVRPHLKPSASVSSAGIDFFLRREEIRRERDYPLSAAGRRHWAGVYAVPVEEQTAPLPAHHLRVAVLRSYGAYARFASSRGAPAHREPVSNVEGALGIAAGMSIDSASVHVQ